MTFGRRDYWMFGAMFLATALIHWPAWQAGFVADFLGWEKSYREQSFWDFLKTFGHPVHQQIPQLVNIILYRLFGTWGLPWYLLFTLLHSLNAFCLYRLLGKLGRLWRYDQSNWLAVAGALFFLCSPYITDATIWRVCVHYLMSGALTLGALYGVAGYLENGKSKGIWLAHICLIINLFTLELALAIPLLSHVIAVAWFLTRPRSTGSAIHFVTILRRLTLPQGALIALFFLANKWAFGQWVGHYGEATHLRFDLMRMLAQPVKYAVKYASFARHFDHADKARLFAFLESGTGLLIAYGLLAVLTGAAIAFGRGQRPGLVLGVLLFWMGWMATVPVSNLHFEWVQFNELDRYGYVASLFFLPAMAVLFATLPGYWKNVPATVFLAISLLFLSRMVGWWSDMDAGYRKLLREYRWYDKKEVFLLATADNFKGIWSFRSYREKPTLQYALELYRNQPLDIRFYEVAQYNQNSLKEGLTVSDPDSTGMIRVEFNQWGNWWWRHGLGASDYRNDLYQVQFKGKWFEFKLKEAHPDAVFLCQSGDEWKVLGE